YGLQQEELDQIVYIYKNTYVSLYNKKDNLNIAVKYIHMHHIYLGEELDTIVNGQSKHLYFHHKSMLIVHILLAATTPGARNYAAAQIQSVINLKKNCIMYICFRFRYELDVPSIYSGWSLRSC
ncbi:hypothetical protein ACJX0J_006502, partial [Zea mays]